MNLKTYQKQAMETNICSNPMYHFLSLASEAGEVCGKVGKIIRDNNGVFTPEKINEISFELGDTLWFLASCCQSLGLSLDKIASDNLKKLADRKERGVIGGSGDKR